MIPALVGIGDGWGVGGRLPSFSLPGNLQAAHWGDALSQQGLYLPSDARRGRGWLLIVAPDQPGPELFDDRWKRAAKCFAGG